MDNQPIDEDPTLLVVVTTEPIQIISGRYRRKQKPGESDDTGGRSRAPIVNLEPESSDSEYSLDEETGVIRRKPPPSLDSASEDYEEDEREDCDGTFFDDSGTDVSKVAHFGDDQEMLDYGSMTGDRSGYDGDGDDRTSRGGRARNGETRVTFEEGDNPAPGMMSDKDVIASRSHIKNGLLMTDDQKRANERRAASLAKLIGGMYGPKRVLYAEAMEAFAKRSVQTVMRYGVTPWIKTVIVGPRESGKSTFLGVFAKSVVSRMSMTGAIAETMVFACDLQKMPFENGRNGVYATVVAATFAQLSVQIPEVAKFADQMTTFFSAVITKESGTAFPKRIAVDSVWPFVDVKLTKLAERVKSVYEDAGKFMELTFSFPLEVATCFGLKHIVYVLDSVEVSDVKLPEDVNVNVCESLKTVIRRYPFVMCCRKETKMMDVLLMLNGSGSDLSGSIDFVNVADIRLPGKVVRNNMLVCFGDGTAPMTLTKKSCAGCIGYIVQWEALAKVVGIAHNYEQQHGTNDSEALCDEHALATDMVRKLIPKIMGHENIPVKAITRVKLVPPR